MWRVWVQSLIRELRSHMLWNVAKNLKKKKKLKVDKQGLSLMNGTLGEVPDCL